MTKKINIIFFSANRAEYSLIQPFLKIFSSHSKFKVHLIIAGSHLDKKFGTTYDEIRKDKIKIISKIKIPLKTNSLIDTAEYSNLLQKEINKKLKKIKADIIFLSSDRFETFAFAVSSYLRKIPIIHYEGGDITEGGALDDNLRHAITKLSNVHLTSNQFSMNRIIKMGEEKWRCLNVGYSPLYSVNMSEFDYSKIVKKFSLITSKPFILFTLHPLVLEKNKFQKEIDESFRALKNLYRFGYQILITYPNFDPGYQAIIDKISEFKKKYKNVKVIKNLGKYNYQSLLYYIGKVKNGSCVGNSSSGIKEAIIFKCPSINIGDRQKSRLKPFNVINVKSNNKEIVKEVKRNLKLKKFGKNPYELNKSFYNLPKFIINQLNKPNLMQKKCIL
ncbi:UDP-N-acetylglucosamine 2-epimerase [Candidatus Pelagibacter sp.]|nr:UDP-N-acetylglucosamine 2-epimerase [Candidatus Pelagibacter sp.]